MPKKRILLQIILLICIKVNTYSCDESETKVKINLKSKLISNIFRHHDNISLTTEEKENEKPISKPYEVTEEISENEPIPYHIQRQISLKINKTNDGLLQVAESRYNVPKRPIHQYQVTEDIDEEEREDENKNDVSDILVQGSTYPQQSKTSPHYINILYNVNNSNINQNNQEEHIIKPHLYTTIQYKNKVRDVKQPLSVIVLHPIENHNQVQRPLRVKVLKPVILSNQDTDHDGKENGNIIIRNDNHKPLLALSVLKSYVPSDNKFNYHNNYHQDDYDEIHETNSVKPILIKVLKPTESAEPNKYNKLYDTLLHDGYKNDIQSDVHADYRKSENNYREELYPDDTSSVHRSDDSNYKSDHKKRYFIYVVDKEKPYVYTRRINKHR